MTFNSALDSSCVSQKCTPTYRYMIKDGHPEVVVQELFGYFRVFSILLVDFETKPEVKIEYLYSIRKSRITWTRDSPSSSLIARASRM